MNKITPEHLAREAYVYVRQPTAAQLLNNPESRRRQYALVARHTSSAGSRSLSLTKISAVQAVVKSVPALSVCSRRSATVPPGRYWRSRRRGWPATGAIGTHSWSSALL